MYAAIKPLNVESFKAASRTMLAQLITEFSEKRSQQIFNWFGQFTKGERTAGYVLTIVFERVQSLARRESAFLLAPTHAESLQLEQEWRELNGLIHHALVNAYPELKWADFKKQMDKIAFDARSHRDIWAHQLETLAAAEAECERLIKVDDWTGADELRGDVFTILRGTIQTITNTSGLNQTLSPN
jgi:hypothetical protein